MGPTRKATQLQVVGWRQKECCSCILTAEFEGFLEAELEGEMKRIRWRKPWKISVEGQPSEQGKQPIQIEVRFGRLPHLKKVWWQRRQKGGQKEERKGQRQRQSFVPEVTSLIREGECTDPTLYASQGVDGNDGSRRYLLPRYGCACLERHTPLPKGYWRRRCSWTITK